MVSRQEIERLRVDNLSISTSLLVRAALKRGINFRLFPERLVWLSDGRRSHYFKGTLLDCNSEVARYIANNKYLSRQILREKNIPTPRTLLLRNPAAWRTILSSRLKFPLVVKPIIASHGLGATMNIKKEAELKKAVERAFSYMKHREDKNGALIEEFFEGHDLRLLVINKKVVSVVERDPAYVVGDGGQTIKQLVDEFNAAWKSGIAYDLPMCPIPYDAETTRRLHSQDKKFEDVPTINEKVYMRWNANASTGGRSIDITDQVHPSIKELAVRSAGSIDIVVAGVDMLVRDFKSNDTTAKNLVVLEINNAPGIDLNQLPYKGEGKDAAGAIIDLLFPKINA